MFIPPSFRDGPKDQTRNLEIPRCAIAHLRFAPSVRPGMTMLKFAVTFTRRRGQVLSQLKPSTTTWWKRSDERNSLENLSRLPRRMVGRLGLEEDAPADAGGRA